MNVQTSTALKNDYQGVSALAHRSGEPVFITENGVTDLVILSKEAYEEREKMFSLRESIFEGEASRIAGEATYSVDEIRMMLDKKYNG